ncbi:ATP-binding protein [Pendulispora brunnea]|uniref:ATP-binding protein n=1 Tax=Pendulispora brunnea TaxID=2905690 RepID=A0ABZ2KJ78_9BACT
MSLLGRARELERLRAAWKLAQRGRAQFALVWGKRRVGKTFLLSHFVQGRRAVFFGATEQSESVELGRLHDALRQSLGDHVADRTGGSFASWEAALKYFAALAKDEPLMLVLDEVPYLLASTPAFASIVQVVWDHLPSKSKLMLVLTGSAIRVVEDLIGPDGPLRGRPTLPLRLEPLEPLAARSFLPRLSPPDFLRAYAACGGYPLHLRSWDAAKSVEHNLLTHAYDSAGLLTLDAEAMLIEQTSASVGYARILAAIGRGRTRYSDIASDAGQRVEMPLEQLVRAGLVRKVLPVGSPKGAKPNYAIDDVYLDFWFSCIYANRAEIASGQGRAVLQRVEPIWQRHLGAVFEDLARHHARRLVEKGELPEDLVVGRWWSVRGPQCEVDVLGLQGSRTALIGEARWQERPLDIADRVRLEQKLASVPSPVGEPVYALWGRAGGTAALKKSGTLVFGLKEMLQKPSP